MMGHPCENMAPCFTKWIWTICTNVEKSPSCIFLSQTCIFVITYEDVMRMKLIAYMRMKAIASRGQLWGQGFRGKDSLSYNSNIQIFYKKVFTFEVRCGEWKKVNHCLKLSISTEAPVAQMVLLWWEMSHTQVWRVSYSEKERRGQKHFGCRAK